MQTVDDFSRLPGNFMMRHVPSGYTYIGHKQEYTDIHAECF